MQNELCSTVALQSWKSLDDWVKQLAVAAIVVMRLY